MLWNLLAKILVDLLVGLIVELAMAVIMSLFSQARQDHQTPQTRLVSLAA